jgi:hypothetical protein
VPTQSPYTKNKIRKLTEQNQSLEHRLGSVNRAREAEQAEHAAELEALRSLAETKTTEIEELHRQLTIIEGIVNGQQTFGVYNRGSVMGVDPGADYAMGASIGVGPYGPQPTMPDPYGEQLAYALDQQKSAVEFEARLRAVLIVAQLHRITS